MIALPRGALCWRSGGAAAAAGALVTTPHLITAEHELQMATPAYDLRACSVAATNGRQIHWSQVVQPE